MYLRARIWAVVAGVVASISPSQDFPTSIEAAQARIEAKQWQQALAILLPLQEKLELDEDLDVLAARLQEVGDALLAQDPGRSEMVLRARGLGEPRGQRAAAHQG